MEYPWGDKNRFNSYAAYMKRIFGERVQKLSVDAGFTCPNRDGNKGTGGCTFCNNDAFNPSYCNTDKSISLQLEEGIEFHRKRYRRANSYLAYFQAFSNTYASVDKLEKVYYEALNYEGVKGLVIGTRPDCMDDEIIELLKSIAKKFTVFVELGVESCNDNTLKTINRGHTFGESVQAIEKCSDADIHTGAHFIFGLPGETREEMLASSRIISGLRLDSVKFHQLQIIRGTVMERQFLENPEDFEIFGFEEYIDFFVSFIEQLNPSIVIERFTSEAPPHLVIAPHWGKKRNDEVMKIFAKSLQEKDTWQGRLFK